MRHRRVRQRFIRRHAVPELALRAAHELPERGLVLLFDRAPPLPEKDPHGWPNGSCLPTAEKALDLGRGPDLLDDRSGAAWMTELVRARRLDVALLVASGYIDADCEIVETAVARLAAQWA